MLSAMIKLVTPKLAVVDAEEAVDATIWTPEYPQPGGPGEQGT
jgi:hypothetical protein